jgi:beta-ketodecanoyl-[acyl-carrier-protein] synthase
VRDRIGIHERRVVDRGAIVRGVPSESGVFGSDLGAKAAEQAIANAGIAATDIEMIICGTSSPDGIYPATAVEIQGKIGAQNAYAFDLLAACSSFAFGLQIARGMIGSGIHRRVLVVSPEYFTAGVNYADPESAFFFGDGAAAAVIEPAGDLGGRSGFQIVDTRAFSIPSRSIRTGLGGTRPFVAGATRNNGRTDAEIEFGAPDDPYFYQEGRRVFRDVVPTVANETLMFLEQNGLVAADVERFWFHQPSALFLGAIAKRLLDVKADDERVVIGYDRFGNTSSSGAPMCMARDEHLQPGQYGCMSVFGAGYSIGLALVRALGT